MNNKDKLKIGNTANVKAQGNEERRHKGKPIEEWIYKVEITKVGRKYFEVRRIDSSYPLTSFYIEDLEEKTDYCSDWKFYFEYQDIFNEMKKEKLWWKIKNMFDYTSSKNKMSLDQIEKIAEILNIKID